MLAVLTAVACGDRRGVRDVNGDGRIVVSCLGDSNTETHWPRPGTRRWCELASERAPEWVFTNHAVGGTTMTQPATPSSWAMPQLERALAEDQPDAVVFAFGTNDVRAGRSTEDIVAAYRAAVERTNRARVLAFVALAPPIYSPQPDHRAAIEGLNAALRHAFPPVPIVDFWTGMTPADYDPDGLHLNDAGQRKRAEAALRALRG